MQLSPAFNAKQARQRKTWEEEDGGKEERAEGNDLWWSMSSEEMENR